MNVTIQRIPNNYAMQLSLDTGAPDVRRDIVVDDTEFAAYVSGMNQQVDPALKERIYQAMEGAGAKMNVFFMAYVQKNVSRLARLMGAIDSVDNELLQDYRIRSMDNGELIDLVGELNEERHKTVKETLEIANRFTGEEILATAKKLLEKDSTDKRPELSRESKNKVLTFFKNNVMK